MSTSAPNSPTIIVVAAGLGSRFDAQAKINAAGVSPLVHKLEQALLAPSSGLAAAASQAAQAPKPGQADGTVLGQCLQRALATQLPVLAVVRKERLPVVSALLARADILVLPEAEANKGMGYSIAAGVQERSASAGWLVVPGDMPLIQPPSCLAVAQALAKHAVAFAQYKGRRGHPVGFSPELFSELMALDGDEGAKRLLGRYPAFGIDVDDPGVLVDVDTPQALQCARHVAGAMESQSA